MLLFIFLKNKNKKRTGYCCSNQRSASYMAHRAAAFPVSTTQSMERATLRAAEALD